MVTSEFQASLGYTVRASLKEHTGSAVAQRECQPGALCVSEMGKFSLRHVVVAVRVCVCVGGVSGVISIQTEPRYLAQAGLELRILLPECLLSICHLTLRSPRARTAMLKQENHTEFEAAWATK